MTESLNFDRLMLILVAARPKETVEQKLLVAAVHESVHAPLRHPDVILRRFPSPLEKYLGEVRLKRFGIGRLTAEADIAVGTDHI
jgi:hypothetical protein